MVMGKINMNRALCSFGVWGRAMTYARGQSKQPNMVGVSVQRKLPGYCFDCRNIQAVERC